MNPLNKIRPLGALAATAAFAASAFGGGMEKTPICEKSPIVPQESACACPWGFTAQALYLQAHNNNGTFDDQSENFGYRLALSYKCDDDLGFRGRYSNWEGDPWSPEITTYDLEVFDDFELGRWHGEYSMGVRYATYEEEDSVDFSGWGPTLGLELTRQLGNGPFSIYANTRVSLLFGDNDDNDSDSFTPVLELGGGIQYTFNAFGNCDSYLRLGIEGQSWEEISYGEDAGLFGGTAELGLSF